MIYRKEQLEKMADGINDKFFPERLYKAQKLDPYDLLERENCTVDWKYISPNADILGMTFFKEGAWPIWDTGKFISSSRPHFESFQKGTIIINQAVLDKKNNRKQENYIVAHEVAHWIKDQDYFSANEGSPVQICKKNSFGKTYWSNSMDELEIIERQTNYLCTAILLPRDILKKEFFRIGRYKNVPNQPIQYTNYMKGWIGELSTIYELNFNPILYRLYDIGVIERP